MAQKGAFLGYNALLGDGSYVENRPSKWQRTLGILNEYNPIPAFERLMKSPMASGGPVSEQNISDGLTVAGTVTGGSSLFPKPRNAVNMGIRAFHGSPHSFPPVRLIEMSDGTRLYQNMHELADTPQGAKIIQEFPLGRFDMSKIGTGEGAQAYGHGLYLAESEGVAKSYRDALSGKQYKFNADPKEIANKYGEGALNTFYKYEGDPKEIGGVISGLRQAVQRNLAEFGVSDVSQLKPMYDGDLASATINMARNADNMEALVKSGDIALDPGHMYEVNINADPNAFLDWDKPLSEQPEAVRKGVTSALIERGLPLGPNNQPLMLARDPRGEMVNASLTAFGDAKNTPELLQKHGIPGIKYLDAGSRGAGDGTRNYVVFDDKLIEIVRKYGIAGASAVLGYNVLQGLNPAQAAVLQKADPSARRSSGW